MRKRVRQPRVSVGSDARLLAASYRLRARRSRAVCVPQFGHLLQVVTSSAVPQTNHSTVLSTIQYMSTLYSTVNQCDIQICILSAVISSGTKTSTRCASSLCSGLCVAPTPPPPLNSSLMHIIRALRRKRVPEPTPAPTCSVFSRTCASCRSNSSHFWRSGRAFAHCSLPTSYCRCSELCS